MKTYVLGHKKPDLDAVVAAISFAALAKNFGAVDTYPSIVEEINPETKFVFEKFSQVSPEIISAASVQPEDQFTLVDHNEVDQRMDGLNENQIVRIYDHHKVNLNLASPIEIQVYPVGSSSTIAWSLFKKNNFNIDQQLASLMLCAVLSDTVGLKSSTTTETDKNAVVDLSKTSGISDVDALTLEIFKAKSNISSLTDEQVVLNDYKVFDFGKKVLIGQIETVEQDVLLSARKEGLLAALSTIKAKEGVDLILLAVTDILKVNTKLLILGEGEGQVATKAFGGSVTDGVLDIGPKLSRKKDIAPAIENAISSLRGV
jgi:manganese-dependent inorganic pyrophosphatase